MFNEISNQPQKLCPLVSVKIIIPANNPTKRTRETVKHTYLIIFLPFSVIAFCGTKAEQGIDDDEFYHYDTPLTVKHETEALMKAGFSSVLVLKNWGATYIIKAVK